jgi:hypothetical protein
MLIAIGIAGACRRLTNFLWIPVVVAPIAVVGAAAFAGLWHLGDIAPLLIAAAASVGWLLLCARAEETGDRECAPLTLFSGSAVDDYRRRVAATRDGKSVGAVAAWVRRRGQTRR